MKKLNSINQGRLTLVPWHRRYLLHPCYETLLFILPPIRKDGAVPSVALAQLFLVQPNRRAAEPVYQQRHFLQAARRPGQGIKSFKAEQCKEYTNSLVETLSRRKHVLLDEPLHDHAYPLPSPFVSCPYHMLKIWIEGSQCPQPAHHKPVRIPEVTENNNVLLQSFERLRLTKCRG